jgi:hypothetical protein
MEVIRHLLVILFPRLGARRSPNPHSLFMQKRLWCNAIVTLM